MLLVVDSVTIRFFPTVIRICILFSDVLEVGDELYFMMINISSLYRGGVKVYVYNFWFLEFDLQV